MKRLIVLLLQAALVAAIVGSTYIYTESRTKPTGVLVFSRNISPHTKITKDMVSLVTVPDSAISREMGRDINEVLDKYTGSEVVRGEPVFVSKLINEQSLTPESRLMGDMRKQSFEVDLARSNGGALKPGDYVDLIYYVEDSAANTARSDIFISKILVLDVRNSEAIPLNSPGKGSGEAEFDSGIGKRIPAVITVAVSPEQAKQIVFYKNRGKIDIAVYPENAAKDPLTAVKASTKAGSMQPATGPAVSPARAGPATSAAAGTAPAKTAAAAAAVQTAPGRAAPDYRTAPNVTLPGKVDNGRNR